MLILVQLLCVRMMFKVRAAMTEEQKSKVVAALPQVDDAEVRSFPIV